jgi:hypothetical protein
VSRSPVSRISKTAACVFVALVGFFVVPTLSAQPAPESAASKSDLSRARSGKIPAGNYFVEFRVAKIGLYGHSYAAYGNVGGRQNYVDLHPMGNYAIMALGHVLPVPANTEWDPDVLKLPVTSRYRKVLNAEQYKKLLAAVQSAKANASPYWNAVTNNCNHFIGELASAIGLQVPGSFQVSYSFVPALKALNEGSGLNGPGATSPKHGGHAPPQS